MSWGVGPSAVFPSATNDLLGSDKWSAGPGAVVFVSKPPFTYGALVNNVWSFAGDSDAPDVNQFLLQPFFNLNLSDGWSVGTSPVITANWEAADDDRWTLPLGGGVGKLFRLGELPIQANLRAYYNAVKPDAGADWQLQFQWTFLFPKKALSRVPRYEGLDRPEVRPLASGRWPAPTPPRPPSTMRAST